jgi:hypothetical protein
MGNVKRSAFLRIQLAAAGLTLLGTLVLPSQGAGQVATNHTVAFNRDIRPILSDTCFPCHGFDAAKRKANLRLDTAEGYTAVIDGRQAVKPGSLKESELWRRVNSKDAKVLMPPPESNKKLTPEQVELLGRWIEEGAVYQKHWAFEAPVRPEPPAVKDAAWVRNDIDRFILANLESKGLTHSKEAPRETLIRRATLDLTGLPPTIGEVEAFLADTAPDSYERLVDRLMASPRYGEHMARYWLDVARYGDTHGLHLDNERSMWPYRDWVVRAFNQNLSFDQFTIWQLAGDLLEKPTRDQLIASGFNRCNVSTSEGGAIDEEFQVRYAVDRVETTSTAWMGLTMGCAVCHDHKLDPISQKEFYEVFSIFNNIAENAMDGNALLPPPSLPIPSPEQEKKLAEFDNRVRELDQEARGIVASLNYVDPATLTNAPRPAPIEKVWIEDEFPRDAQVSVNDGNEANRWVSKNDGPVFSGERSLLRSGKGLHQTFFSKSAEPLTVGPGDKFFAYVYLDPADPPKALMLQYHTEGWGNRGNWGDADAIPYGTKGTFEKVQAGALPETGKWVRLELDAATLGLKPGTRITGMAFTQFDGKAYWDKAGQVSVNDPASDPDRSLIAWVRVQRSLGDQSSAPKEIKEIVKKGAAKCDDSDKSKLREYYLTQIYADPSSPLQSIRTEAKSVRSRREAVEKEVPSTMISKELEKPRPAWVLIRGAYDKHGEPVSPGVPSVLPPLHKSETTNRLTFAQWLVDPRHPLTARVTVNRFWQQFFGTGIVKTSEDFGTKGEWPSHPELLDWLATEFMGNGWDVKKMVKMFVCSATYRQDSAVTEKLHELDPENRWLGRGPRYRLDAEELRDGALFAGGLLNLTIGGHGVRTYQPSGIWEAVGYTTSNTAKYTRDSGDALYRRSLYLFWKRTAPQPLMTTFDAPSREQCRARRERTNTPLQALLTMNDTQYFEAARHLGYRMLREGGKDDADRLRYGFKLVTARTPTESESHVLAETLNKQRQHFVTAEDAARKAVSVGDSPTPSDVPVPELAAYTMVANLLLNLDEVVTKN